MTLQDKRERIQRIKDLIKASIKEKDYYKVDQFKHLLKKVKKT